MFKADAQIRREYKIKTIYLIVKSFGLDVILTLSSLKNVPNFVSAFLCFFSQKKQDKSFKLSLFPILSDCGRNQGHRYSTYFIQDLYFAKKIFKKNPDTHLDIGSRMDGFISSLLVFRSVSFLDCSEVEHKIKNLNIIRKDLSKMNKINKQYDSVSCLHAIEHFGLGRYGDSINYNGWKVGLQNISSYVKKNGDLYISVPIGNTQTVYFNAHRIFHPKTILVELEANGFKLIELKILDQHKKIREINLLKRNEYDNCTAFYSFKKIY